VDFKDLRERRVLQFLVTYVAVGWIALEAVGLLVEQAVLPGWIFRVAFTLFLCGIPGALIVTWFHGAKGDQVAPPVEKWLLGIVGVFAIGASAWVGRASMEPAVDAPVELTDTEDPRRVAVLYFGTQGGGEDAEFLAAGLTESLIDELSTVDSLSVVSRNGSQIYRDPPRPALDSIGRALEVGTLVDGTVAVAGDRVRVTVNMINAEDGTQFENTRFERPRAQIFDLQDTLSLQVADFLRQRIGIELDRVVLRRGTDSPEAWELLQRAAVTADRTAEYLGHGDVDAASRALEEAEGVLAQAEAADPSWVEPVTRRGWLAYRQSRLGGLDRTGYDQWTTIGLEHADRALAMAPEDRSALELKGTLLYWRYLLNLIPDELESDEAFHTAEDLFRAAGTPSAQASLSHLLLNRGENELAYAAARNSYAADPFLENANLTLWRLASTQWTMGDERQTERWCDEGLRRFPEDYRFHQCQLMLFGMEGVPADVPAAWQHLRDFVEFSPPQLQEVNERQGMQYMAMALVRAQLPDSARAVMVQGRTSAEVDPTREIARLESIPRSWLGDWEEVTRLMGLYLSANPLQVDGYRTSLAENAVPWYHEALQDRADFRSLLGLN
jgi:TolB-like protein